MLNRLCGTTAFHIWNVGEIPDVDVKVLMKTYQMQRDIAELD